MYKRFTSIFISLLCTFWLKAQEPMSLSDAIEYAMMHHSEIRLAELKLKDADWQIKENKAVALPQVNLAMDYSHYLLQPGLPTEALGFGEPGQKITFALKNSIGGHLTFDQLIFNNSYLATIKAARMYKDYVLIQMEGTIEKLRNRVTDDYMPALVISEAVNILDKNIENQQKLFAETKANYKAGFVEQLDVDRLEYTLSRLTTERESMVRQRDILIDALKFTINQPIAEPLILEDSLDYLLDVYDDIDPEEQLDYMNRPDYVAALKARELSEIRTNAYRRDWFPVISFFASYDPGFQGNDELFWIPSAIMGFRLSMPLWDSGLSRSKQERSMIQSLQIEEQKTTLKLAYDLEIEAARKQYYSAQQKLRDQERNLELAQRIYNTSQTKFSQGVGSSFEVTQALFSLYSSEGDLVTARYDYLKSLVAIKKALGKN